ncbi:MAG: NUDIX hydrolase [SAR324 cluster bacterium]|nr:NUDIX hydrolase [SAR324 cluster bacterium]MBL7034376.1 NUDIX hydrolase [SAR324 cluster bacterium]
MAETFANNPDDTGPARVLEERSLYRGNWSEMVEFSYVDDENKVQTWEGLHRKHRAEAVIIIALMKPSGRYILIRQFRPPTNSYLLEFPAGLVDPGESLETTAIRELYEETGYRGKVEKLSPKLYSSPGILSETVSFVELMVDENRDENQQPTAQNEPGEFITVFLKQPDDISKFFIQEMMQGVKFDVKLFTYFMAQGLLPDFCTKPSI